MLGFHVEMIKPSHYYDEGYVIQWWKASIPSNSLASLYAIVRDSAERHVLGGGCRDHLRWLGRVQQLRFRGSHRSPHHRARGRDRVPRGRAEQPVPCAVDMAREFRARGIAVVIGGFHVSGCL